MNTSTAIPLFLRTALSASFLSAVADRFGWWPAEVSVWGNWEAFVGYTQLINPWASSAVAGFLAVAATALEVVLAAGLLLGVRTRFCAAASGALLLLFGASMALATGIKGPLDFSVFSASAGAFALATMKRTRWELDAVLKRS